MAILYCEASDCDPSRKPSTCQAIELAVLDINLNSKQPELDKQDGSTLYTQFL